MKDSYEEFPLLPAYGLYAANIRGDGNCLFNALSDQLYGSQDRHHTIRARVIAHMQEHADYYKQFLEVFPGGGTRRNPKRKNAGAFSYSQQLSAPTAEEVDRVFHDHLLRMAKGGTWGDNMEIVAFSSAYAADVKIYQRDQAYMISGSTKGNEDRVTCHIAYHDWEHYSSIRNVDGPHQGLPQVNVKELSADQELQQKVKLEQATIVQDWQVEIVEKSLPYHADKTTIRQTLERYRGNVNHAVDRLLEMQDSRSFSSNQSSSVERDVDSDDEVNKGPCKKQDRRMSRATKSAQKKRQEFKRLGPLSPYGKSLESLINANYASSSSSSKKRSPSDGDDTEDEDWSPEGIEPLKDGDTSSGSEYAATAAPKTIKLKLNTKSEPATPCTPESNLTHSAPRRRRLITAREKKELQKRAQKNQAKERKQAAVNSKTSQSCSHPIDNGTSNPSLTQGMRTVYI